MGDEWPDHVVPLFAAYPDITFVVGMEVYVDDIHKRFVDKVLSVVSDTRRTHSKLVIAKQDGILWWNHMVPSLIGNGSTSGGRTCT